VSRLCCKYRKHGNILASGDEKVYMVARDRNRRLNPLHALLGSSPLQQIADASLISKKATDAPKRLQEHKRRTN
jgi:hypothetical protein